MVLEKKEVYRDFQSREIEEFRLRNVSCFDSCCSRLLIQSCLKRILPCITSYTAIKGTLYLFYTNAKCSYICTKIHKRKCLWRIHRSWGLGKSKHEYIGKGFIANNVDEKIVAWIENWEMARLSRKKS